MLLAAYEKRIRVLNAERTLQRLPSLGELKVQILGQMGEK